MRKCANSMSIILPSTLVGKFVPVLHFCYPVARYWLVGRRLPNPLPKIRVSFISYLLYQITFCPANWLIDFCLGVKRRLMLYIQVPLILSSIISLNATLIFRRVPLLLQCPCENMDAYHKSP